MIKKAIYLLIIFSVLLFSGDKSYVNIPCGLLQDGMKKEFRLKNSYQSVKMTERVELVGNKILLYGATEMNMNGVAHKTEMISSLRRDNGTVYFDEMYTNAKSKYSSRNVNVPPVPMCGKVPKKYTYITKIKSASNYINGQEMKSTIKIKKIGEKIITVPVGTFKTEVFESRSTIEMVNIPNAALTEVMTISYISNKVGEVKKEIFSKTIMPKIEGLATPFDNGISSKSTIELISYKMKSQITK